MHLCAILFSVYSEQKPKKRLPLAIAYKADPTASGNVIVTQTPSSDDVLEDSGVFITQVRSILLYTLISL